MRAVRCVFACRDFSRTFRSSWTRFQRSVAVVSRVCRKREKKNHPNRAAAATEWPPNSACRVPVGEFRVAVSLVSTEDFETGLSWARVATGPSRLGWPDQARPRLLRSERNYRTSVSVCAVERRGTKQRSCEKRRRTQQQQQHQQQQQ